MIAEHGANDTSWDVWQLELADGYGGFRDSKTGRRIRVYPHICYGCMSTFQTKDELVTHLSDTHGAS